MKSAYFPVDTLEWPSWNLRYCTPMMPRDAEALTMSNCSWKIQMGYSRLFAVVAAADYYCHDFDYFYQKSSSSFRCKIYSRVTRDRCLSSDSNNSNILQETTEKTRGIRIRYRRDYYSWKIYCSGVTIYFEKKSRVSLFKRNYNS